jgi:hypothetical protein
VIESFTAQSGQRKFLHVHRLVETWLKIMYKSTVPEVRFWPFCSRDASRPGKISEMEAGMVGELTDEVNLISRSDLRRQLAANNAIKHRKRQAMICR